MRRLDLARKDSGLRARRWDAILLGSALPGLVAAARLARHGLRVLVVEEEAAARLPAPLREPFFLGPAGPDSLIDSCLSGIGVTLRDRRRIEADDPSYQVVLSRRRVDVGAASRTASELVVWGLAKPEEAQQWLQDLASSAEAVRGALAEAPLVRRGGLRGLARGRGTGAPQVQGLPDWAASAAPAFARFVRAQLRALSNLDRADLPPEAQALLLGGALAGGGRFRGGDATLGRLVRRRIEAMHGEIRTLSGPFEIASVDPHPAILHSRTREVWLGRVLILNAPSGLLADVLREAELPVPEFLKAATPVRRRVTVHLRCHAHAVPDGMAHRVIRVLESSSEKEDRVVTLARHPGQGASDPLHLVVRTVFDWERTDPDEAAQIAHDAATSLMPFSEDQLVRVEHRQPRWDDEDVLPDPPAAAEWPDEVNLRMLGRPPVFALPREETGALGLEGDLLLGWRAGDAIAAELG